MYTGYQPSALHEAIYAAESIAHNGNLVLFLISFDVLQSLICAFLKHNTFGEYLYHHVFSLKMIVVEVVYAGHTVFLLQMQTVALKLLRVTRTST